MKHLFNNKVELIDYLKEINIPLNKWGDNGNKSIENLWGEIINNDCIITENNLRQISVVAVYIEKNDHILYEDYQILKDGNIRQRNKPPREKKKEQESVLSAAIRCLKEELNLEESDFEILTINETPIVYTKESASYPGLKTRYLQYDVSVNAKIPFNPFSTKENGEEHDPVDAHYWKWTKK